MKKEEVISQVQNSLGSLFTKDDVVKCINMVVEQPTEVIKLKYPSREWLAKIKHRVLQRILDTDFNDSDMFDISEFEFGIKYGNTIEIDSYEVDACALKVYIENEIEEAFSELEDDITEMEEENEESKKQEEVTEEN